MPANFKRDSAGIESILKSSGVASVMHTYAVVTNGHARRIHPEAEESVVNDYVTDRACSSVTFKDVRAKGWQVADGFLTEAAGRAGLEVTRKPVL